MQILRKDKGLTQEELAKESGIAYTTIVKLEQGLSNQAPEGIMKPTLDTIKAVIESDLKKYYDEA